MAKRFVRPIRIEGNIAYVPLTKGYVATIDAADVPLVEGFNWCAFVTPRWTVYAGRGSSHDDGKHLAIRMHRVIIGAAHGLAVDHIDGNGLNNRRSNLRLATRAQNQHNRGVRADSASGLKGVLRHALTGRWRAYIRVDGKKIHLGYFDTAEAAHAAYSAAAHRLHGEFARTA